LEVGLRGARAGAAATASLGDRGLEWNGMDWVGKTSKEGRGRRGGDATHGGKEREREILSKQGGEKEDEEQSDLLYFLFSF